jgi:2-dehydropantoate 2-reductase
MKVCIYGAGSMGGYIGAGLALAEAAEVTLIARGPHLAAMQAKGGLTLINEAGETRLAACRAVESAKAAGPQDYVVIALKAPTVPAIIPAMRPLLGPETVVVTAANGVPWWYFYRLAGPYENKRLATIDPGDVQWNGIGPERVLGCVLWPAAGLPEPGVVKVQQGNRMPIGEPDGSRSPRAERFSQAMAKAGFESPVHPRIRDELWAKLWGNLSFNPVSALTQATLEELASEPESVVPIRRMMQESQAVAEKLGVKFTMSLDERIATTRRVGAHKTSMLQDLLKGRVMELDALVGVVCELGRLTGVPTPTIDLIYGLTKQRARVAGSDPKAMTEFIRPNMPP